MDTTHGERIVCRPVNKAILVLFLFFHSLLLFSQSIDQQLTTEYRRLIQTIFDDENHEGGMLAFKVEMIRQLGMPSAFENPFDSLAGEILVVNSPDGKIRFFSWDCLGGGVRHSNVCLAQFLEAGHQPEAHRV